MVADTRGDIEGFSARGGFVQRRLHGEGGCRPHPFVCNERVGEEIALLAERHGVCLRVDARHIERVCRGDAEPFALADGIADRAAVPPQKRPVHPYDSSLRQRTAAPSLDERCEVVSRHEADALAVALACRLEALLARDAPHVALLGKVA